MAGRNGSQKKGLFSGFLTGTALCLCLGAAATYISPLGEGEGDAAVPSVGTTEVSAVRPKTVAGDVSVITPRSDTQRDIGDVPTQEAPASDRDYSNVAANVRQANEPVQTGTPEIEAPNTADTSDAQTARAEEIAPKAPTVGRLSTSETAPERSVAEIDVSTGTAANTAPESESSALESPLEDETPTTLALNAPRVETPDNASNQADPAPALQAEIGGEQPKLAAPSAPVVPKARPVIALSKPAPTPRATTPLEAPKEESAATSDVSQSSDPVLVVPDAEERAPDAPQVETPSETAPEAPVQVETPVIDAEPEAPVIEQASVAPETGATDTTEEAKPEGEEGEEDAPGTAVADRRNPPPPSFEGRAFDAFSVKFIAPNNKPFLTVVLEHVGGGSVDMYDLLNFGQPITFGVNSVDTLSKWRENEFRKAGFEVVALVPEDPDAGLSEGMTSRSVATRIDNYLTAVPGAVAVLDRSESDLYRDPRKVTRVAEELNLTGRALLVHEKFGINRALEAARSTGTPSASLVRIIDEQRDAASIRRALDRAALDASKTGAAIVFGRTYPETVAALLPWLLGNSARSVTLAPLTSTMKRMVE